MRVVGLLMHLWSRKILEKIGDAYGGFLAIDEDIETLFELCWARVLVRLGDSEPPKFVEVVVGGNKFLIQMWWEFSPSLKVVPNSEKRRKIILSGKDDGEARTKERMSLGGTCDAGK